MARRPWIDEPAANIDEYIKKQPSLPADYNLQEKLNHWREHGIVIFEQAVDPDLVDELLEDIDVLVRHPSNYEVTVDLGGGNHVPIKTLSTEQLIGRDNLKINNLHFISKAAIRCALNKFATSFLTYVFQDVLCLQQSLFFIRGSQQPIHLDYPYVREQQHIANLAASWVALEDVHQNSGPLEYYCGSHMPEKLPFFDWGDGSITLEPTSQREPQEFVDYLQEQMGKLGIKPRVFLPKKGDILIWHGYLAHAGSKINDPSRTRKSLVTHYTCNSSYNPTHRFPDAEEKKRFYEENGGRAYDLPWTAGWNMLASWEGKRG